jgi:excisionase family DNA binding protein
MADVVSLDQLAAEPALVRTLSSDALVELARRVAVLEATVRVELAIAGATPWPSERATSPPPAAPDRLLTIPHVAAILSVPKSYAYELARQQRLPALRFGKYVRVEPAALAAWLRSGGQRQGAADGRLNTVLSSPHGRRRGAAGARSARAHPG